MEIRTEFVSRFLSTTLGHRYQDSKFVSLLTDLWREIKFEITSGGSTSAAAGRDRLPVLRYLELHIDDRCQLRCAWCRDGLRDVPRHQKYLDDKTLLALIREAHAINPRVHLRISGTIGEPLLHPAIVAALRLANHLGLSWSITTNGLLLNKPGLMHELVQAQHVHISLDAPDDAKYQALKHGRPGDFETVLDNIAALVRLKSLTNAAVTIVVSVLLQSQTEELPALSQRLREIGVNTLEIKMQHFDERRVMSSTEVDRAYAIADAIQSSDVTPTYRLVKFQSREQALAKVSFGSTRRSDFDVCYASLLGLSATIDAAGRLMSCCQPATCQGRPQTLGAQGDLVTGLTQAWSSQHRCGVLQQSPRDHCAECSSSDKYINDFVTFLRQAYELDPSFLDWVEMTYVPQEFR